jgi:hypothetical protein
VVWGIHESLACDYFTGFHAYDAPPCGPPRGLSVQPLPTHDAQVRAAVVRVPAGVAAPDLTSYDSVATLGLVTAVTVNPAVAAASIACALPPGEVDVCAAGFAFHLATYVAGSLPGAELDAMLGALGRLLSPPAKPADRRGEPPKCEGALVDAQLQSEVHPAAALHIPVPAATVRLPANLAGQVTVAFVPGDIAACRNGVTSKARGLFADGELTVDARADGGATFGPFSYQAATTAWQESAVMPSGQDLVTHFDTAHVDAELAPSLSLGFSAEHGVAPALTLADVRVHALASTVTLVSDGEALLRVSLGPSLDFTAEISRSAIETEVADAEAEGADALTATTDIAETVAADVAVAVEEDASAFYAVDVSLQMPALSAELEIALLDALGSDAALASVVESAAADAVPAADLGAADALAIDEAMGTTLVEVDALDELLLVLLL